MYSRGSCKNPTFWVGVSARAVDGDGTPPLPGFATASLIKGVTITASQRTCTRTLSRRNNEMARMAGLEPATAALTVQCSTIELHPNWWRESDSNRRSSGYGPAAGTTPVNPALSHETIVKPRQVLQLPRKSQHQHKRIPCKSVTLFSQLFSPWQVRDDGRSARSRARRQTPARLPPRCVPQPYRPRRSPACGQSNASRTPPAHVS